MANPGGTTSVAFLVIRRDDGFGEVYNLSSKTTCTIGRATSSQIVLRDDLCSREHAEVYCTDGKWFLRDKNSLNGSRRNNEPIKGDVPIEAGDEIQLGRTRYLFLLRMEDLPGLPAASSELDDGSGDQLEIRQRLRATRFLTKPMPRPAAASPTHELTMTDNRHTERALGVLYRLAIDMGSTTSIEELVEVVLDGLQEGIPSEVAAIQAIKDNREQEIIGYRQRNPRMKTFQRVSQFVAAEVIASREAILAENISHNPYLRVRESLADLKVSSLICAPIFVGDSLLGLLHLYSSEMKQTLTGDDLEFSLAVSRQFGAAWHQLKRQGTLTATAALLRDNLRLESELIGSSEPLRLVEKQISRVASTSATVLIRGESGSGKELVARAIHFSSPRREGPFVTLNCAAIAETLLESELFGHEIGAYTGATEKMIGKFEAADRGTIFLDEIGEMPPSTQSKFLRVLEGHPFERLGGNVSIKVDVRVVAATNRPLEEAVRAGQFRMDLFYRLQVVEIRVPPLRDRISDIPLLADHFLKRFARETGRRLRGYTPAAMAKLQDYNWPGNVREFRNAIERAVALSTPGRPLLDVDDIWLSSIDLGLTPAKATFEPISLEEMERRHIEKMLQHTDWNKSQAATILGIERSTLDRKIKAYDLKKDG